MTTRAKNFDVHEPNLAGGHVVKMQKPLAFAPSPFYGEARSVHDLACSMLDGVRVDTFYFDAKNDVHAEETVHDFESHYQYSGAVMAPARTRVTL